MKKNKIVLARVSTRVLPSQNKFIKSKSKELGLGEGELYRLIIQYFIDNNK